MDDKWYRMKSFLNTIEDELTTNQTLNNFLNKTNENGNNFINSKHQLFFTDKMDEIQEDVNGMLGCINYYRPIIDQKIMESENEI